jgi:hypothetical protein
MIELCVGAVIHDSGKILLSGQANGMANMSSLEDM